MESKPLTDEIAAYCEGANISASTLCVRALGNSRFLDRFNRRVEKAEQDAEKLRAYMAAHPAPEQTQEAQQ